MAEPESPPQVETSTKPRAREAAKSTTPKSPRVGARHRRLAPAEPQLTLAVEATAVSTSDPAAPATAPPASPVTAPAEAPASRRRRAPRRVEPDPSPAVVADLAEPRGPVELVNPLPEPLPVVLSGPGDRTAVAHLRGRARRSVSRMPTLVAPIDIPEDAPGRVEFIFPAVQAEHMDHLIGVGSLHAEPNAEPVAAGVTGPAEPTGEGDSSAETANVSAASWWLLAALAVAMVLVFAVGMALTR